MAQIIKHRRGSLESVSGATKRAGELLVVTGSAGITAANGDSILFVGIDGSTVTPANKILQGTSTPDLTGASYDTSIDGMPFYNTSENKLYVLNKAGNVEVQATANTNGTGIVSSSAQVSAFNTFLEINGDSVVSSSAQISGYNTFLEINGDNVVSSSAQVIGHLGGTGIVSSSAQIDNLFDIDGLVSTSAQIDALGFLQVNGDSVVSSSAQISGYNTFLEINGDGVVSGSSQISADQTDGWVADVKTQLNSNTVISGSSQVFSDVSGDVTIASNGVASIGSGVIVNADVNANAAIDYTKIDFGGSSITSGSLGLSVSDGSSIDTVNVGVDTFNIVGTTNEVTTTLTNNQIKVGLATNPTVAGNLTITGNLTVSGTTTSVNSNTIELGDNIIELNGTGAQYGGLLIGDVTAPNQVSGSLLWDATNDQWIAGASGSESKVLLANGDDIVSSSAQVNTLIAGTAFSSSVDSRLDAVEATSGDLANTYLEINGDSVVSSSAQISAYNTFLEINGDSVVSSSAQVSAYNTFLEINGDGVHSGSAQVVSALSNQTVDFGTGDISGSNLNLTGNANIDGNIVLGGNITIGDASSDTISFGGEVASDIIPSANNTYDLGSSTDKFAEVHATTIYGSISSTNGVVSGSSQVFSDVSGDVTIASNGVASIGSGVIVNADINANAAIDHSKIDFG